MSEDEHFQVPVSRGYASGEGKIAGDALLCHLEYSTFSLWFSSLCESLGLVKNWLSYGITKQVLRVRLIWCVCGWGGGAT